MTPTEALARALLPMIGRPPTASEVAINLAALGYEVRPIITQRNITQYGFEQAAEAADDRCTYHRGGPVCALHPSASVHVADDERMRRGAHVWRHDARDEWRLWEIEQAAEAADREAAGGAKPVNPSAAADPDARCPTCGQRHPFREPGSLGPGDPGRLPTERRY